ncbi:MAG TPA: sugar phosphate isomerase/epimerase family protein [Verrucomicrobiae bacterium]|jgi:sugar phosphate isomerase/epimerase|nr:sugar phosphate isomerase/epimerase family protein [Verrucomicrobiae bacterium]
MKFAICNEIFQGWELEAAMEFAARLGYQGIEIAPFTLAPLVTEMAPEARARVRAAAHRHGLEICGLHWLLARTTGFHLNHPEAEVRERTARYLVDLVDCCADLGGKILVLGSPQQRQVLPGVTAPQARAWALETMREAVAQAVRRGVTWCLEPLGPHETNFLNTAAEALDFARALDSPAAQIILDVKAMSSESVPIPEIIRAAAPHFAHFHANDPNLKGPGFGAVDFRPIAAALRATGYRGFISVEVLNFDEGAERIASQSLRYLREAFTE